MRTPKGFTLIELVMVIVLMAILASVAASFFGPMVNLFFFTPKETMVTDVGNRLTDTIIEGDSSALGLRYISSLTAATTTQISYTDADDNTIVFRWDSGDKRIYRNLNGAGEVVMPPKAGAISVDIDGAATGVIFKYYDENEVLLGSPVATPSQVKRIQMDWVMSTGSGQVKEYQGSITLSSGVYIKQF